METDPDEMQNVYSNPEYLDIVEEMTSRLENELIKVVDTVDMQATSRYYR